MYIHAYTCITYAHITTHFCTLRTKNLLKFPILKQKQTTTKNPTSFSIIWQRTSCRNDLFSKEHKHTLLKVMYVPIFLSCWGYIWNIVFRPGLLSSRKKEFPERVQRNAKKVARGLEHLLYEEKLRARRSGVQPGGDLEMIWSTLLKGRY